MAENAASTVSETDAINTAETSTSSEPVEENSAKSDLTSTSGQSEELMRKLAEFTANKESVTSIGEELENIPQVLSEPQSEQCSHSEKETGADKNEEEWENLDTDLHETSGNVDTSDIANTVELDSETSVAQSQVGHVTEAQSISVIPESSSLAETQASGESKTLDIKQDEPVARRNVPEEMNTAEESDVTENFNLSSSRDNAVEETVESLSPQVTVNETSAYAVNENSRTSELYPNLDSIARKSGTAIFRTCTLGKINVYVIELHVTDIIIH